jgi:hypothetical protein
VHTRAQAAIPLDVRDHSWIVFRLAERCEFFPHFSMLRSYRVQRGAYLDVFPLQVYRIPEQQLGIARQGE